MDGTGVKNSTAWEMVISSTSLMLFPLYLTARTSGLNRFPWHSLHVTVTDGRKFISMTSTPAPLQASQRPPFTLKENLLDLKPRILASGVSANRLRMGVSTPV